MISKELIGIYSTLVISIISLFIACGMIIAGIILDNNTTLILSGTSLIQLILGIWIRSPRIKFRNANPDLRV